MSTDRELLTAAAQAAGIRLEWTTNRFGNEWPVYYTGPGGVGETRWNPLIDDGDALRLAVKLGIDIQFEAFGPASTFCQQDASIRSEEAWGDDPCAATRRAIVRAAAAIGRTL